MATREELARSKLDTAAVIEQVKKVHAQASTDIESVKRQAAEQLAFCNFGLERLSTDNNSIKFYTGFPSYKHITDFYEFIGLTAVTMTHCYASGESESRPGGARTMRLIDELFVSSSREIRGLNKI